MTFSLSQQRRVLALWTIQKHIFRELWLCPMLKTRLFVNLVNNKVCHLPNHLIVCSVTAWSLPAAWERDECVSFL